MNGNQECIQTLFPLGMEAVLMFLLYTPDSIFSDWDFVLPSRPEEPPSWSGYMGKMFMAATNYLPSQVSGMMSQDRAFATVRLNFSGQRNICVLSTYVNSGAMAAEQWPH